MKKLRKIAELLTENDIGPIDLDLLCTCSSTSPEFSEKVDCLEKALREYCKNYSKEENDL